MTLLKLDLTLGERHLITAILNRVQKTDEDISRAIRHIRLEFDLRGVDHRVRKLSDRLGELGLGIPWDAFIDPTYLAEDIRDSFTSPDPDDENAVALSKKAKKELGTLADDILAIADKRPFTLDSDRIAWLLTQTKKVDLSVMFVTGQDGKRVEVELVVQLGQWEILANLEDRLLGAVKAKGD